MKTIVSIIVALAANNAIGKDNQLLCYVPGDLKRFKELTSGHTVIMGRLTFESLPNGALPNRRNIVISSNPDLHLAACETFLSLEDAIKAVQGEEEVFIIGGGMVYKQALEFADRLYLTQIEADLEGDTFFPAIDFSNWDETFVERHDLSEKCPYSFAFANYNRK